MLLKPIYSFKLDALAACSRDDHRPQRPQSATTMFDHGSFKKDEVLELD